jgi:molybdopterin/thiamine biosynthesis adenylyltransferase
MEKFDYSDLVNRNWGFISSDLQEKIRSATLLFAGCGLGSAIAETAARIGFSNFILVDGDIIESSNLNRQSFTSSMIGENKASALKHVIMGINPEAQVIAVETFIRKENVTDLVEKSDFVINTVDAGEVYFALADEGQRLRKTVLLPLNIGFGGFLWSLNKDSDTLADLLGTTEVENDLMFYEKIFARMNAEKIPNYIANIAKELFRDMHTRGNSPQMVIGARIVSALLVTTIIKVLDDGDVAYAPQFQYVDFLNSKDI